MFDHMTFEGLYYDKIFYPNDIKNQFILKQVLKELNWNLSIDTFVMKIQFYGLRRNIKLDNHHYHFKAKKFYLFQIRKFSNIQKPLLSQLLFKPSKKN